VLGGAVAQWVRHRRRGQLLEQRRVLAPVLIAPAVIFILALVGLPLLLAIYLAFSSATSGSLSGHWVGLANFRHEWGNAIFQRALWNTFWFTIISQLIVVVGAGVLAHALVHPFRGRWFLRFLILLPWAAPIALGTIAFQWMLDPTFSIFNWMLVHTHTMGAFCSVTGISNCSATSPPNWVGDPTLARISIILVHAWRILPFATVIFIAGIASIPTEVHDAAAVDGATGLRKFWYVSLPLQLPIAIIALLFGIVFTATDMTVAYVLTHGGPFNSTHMLTTWAFTTGIESGSLGEGAAVSLFLLPVLALVAIGMLVAAKRAEVA
jgi:multiple sugar transport system permease protein